MTTAFEEKGLLSHDHKMVYADPARLAKVTAPALFLVGDRDRMCPPEGCRRTYQVLWVGQCDNVVAMWRHALCVGGRLGALQLAELQSAEPYCSVWSQGDEHL